MPSATGVGDGTGAGSERATARLAYSRIAFARWVEGQGEQVFTMRADGSDVRQLTGGKERAATGAPVEPWTARGSASPPAAPGHSSLWLMGADGSGQRRLTGEQQADDVEPGWSPDGATIAFARGDCGADGLWLLDVGSDWCAR